MKRLVGLTGFVCVLAVLGFAGASLAQEYDDDGTAIASEPMGPPVPAFQDSLLFGPLEVSAVRDAVERGRVRATTREDRTPDVPAVRYIKVSGVSYRNETDWVVWLNDQPVTPGSLLPEVVDIRVQRDRVFLRWFDRGTGSTISIVLRPNQTYDVLTGLLLPG